LRRRTYASIASIALMALGLTAGALWCRHGAEQTEPPIGRIAPAELTLHPQDLQAVARFASARLRGAAEPLPPALRVHTEGVYVSARARAHPLGQAWGAGD